MNLSPKLTFLISTLSVLRFTTRWDEVRLAPGGPEAVELLKLYLEERRKSSKEAKIPPEKITEESPLIADSRSNVPKPVGEKQIYKLLHNLYTDCSPVLEKIDKLRPTTSLLRFLIN